MTYSVRLIIINAFPTFVPYLPRLANPRCAMFFCFGLCRETRPTCCTPASPDPLFPPPRFPFAGSCSVAVEPAEMASLPTLFDGHAAILHALSPAPAQHIGPLGRGAASGGLEHTRKLAGEGADVRRRGAPDQDERPVDLLHADVPAVLRVQRFHLGQAAHERDVVPEKDGPGGGHFGALTSGTNPRKLAGAVSRVEEGALGG